MADPRDRESRGLLTDLALARAPVDRAEHRRGDHAWLESAWANPTSRVLCVHRSRFPLDPASGTPALDWVSPVSLGAEWDRALDPDVAHEVLFLGMDAGIAHFAARRGPVPADTGSASARWSDLRASGASLGDRDAGLAVTAVALDNWHASHPRCARCGEPTLMRNAGWMRQCPACDGEHYPRTDPAVIMLAIDQDDRALLGRRGDWQPGWFSTLAGFVEAGESAEAAVRREIAEEAGVVVDEVTYLGSQPWPFPCSLMLGYHARAVTTEITVDETEIVEARWFSREELRAACASGEAAVPPAVSIARKLIERWFGGPIPGEWGRP